MTTDEKDFLSRWSRRKQAAREGLAEPETDQAPVPAESTDPAEAGPEADQQAADESAYDDVDFDALDYSSDYTRFMGKDVPEMIQRRALRALWRSDPILANIDGLNDYDDDFTDAATVVQNLVSAYKTGQGYRTDEEIAAADEEHNAEAAAKAETGDDAEPAQARDETGTGAGPSAQTDVADAAGEHSVPDADSETKA